MDNLIPVSDLLVDRQLWLSFLGSLLAGGLLITSAPLWLKQAKRCLEEEALHKKYLPFFISVLLTIIVVIVAQSLPSPTRYVFVPPSHLHAEDIKKIKIKCQLEAVQAFPPGGSTNRKRDERNDNAYKYYSLCLEREGFTRTKMNNDNVSD